MVKVTRYTLKGLRYIPLLLAFGRTIRRKYQFILAIIIHSRFLWTMLKFTGYNLKEGLRYIPLLLGFGRTLEESVSISSMDCWLMIKVTGYTLKRNQILKVYCSIFNLGMALESPGRWKLDTI